MPQFLKSLRYAFVAAYAATPVYIEDRASHVYVNGSVVTFTNIYLFGIRIATFRRPG